MEEIIIGRDRTDMEKFGRRGLVFIGRHIVGEGEEAHLTNPVLMDVVRPHLLLVLGKRGGGKSYSAAVIAEEMGRLPPEVSCNLSTLFIDTMGIYWSMKNPNERDRELLTKWGLKPQGMNCKVFVPKAYVDDYEKAGVAVDGVFTFPCSEIAAEDWMLSFGFSMIDPHGILVERAVKETQKKFGGEYSIKDLIDSVAADRKSEQCVKDAVTNRFLAAEDWGMFEKKGTPVEKLILPGTISILDVSHYTQISEGWSVRGMMIGLLCRKIYEQRLIARKLEEMETITSVSKKTIPMVWIIIDEAHMFIPESGATPATGPLLTLIRQGRQPGISLLLITQRPEKLHEDALSQADMVLSHMLTSKADLDALRAVMQTYAMNDIEEYMNSLPKTKGAALMMDDNSERIFTLHVRPRLSWHAGGSPSAIKEKGMFDD